MPHNSEQLKNFVDHMDDHMSMTLNLAQKMQEHVVETEGDSDLNRKLTCYLIPGLTHWITGQQGGNIKDLKETLATRCVEQETKQDLGS